MNARQEFINDVLNDAYLAATEMNNGRITIPILDDIVYSHPYYIEASRSMSLETIESAVEEIEIILEREGRM